MAATVAGWISYAADRGLTVADDAASAQALVRAGDYILYRYIANLLPGYDETLSVVDPATYEAAAIELANPGFFSTTYTEAQQKTLTEVKGIKWTVTGSTTGVYSSMPTSSLIDAMFYPYIYDRDANQFMFRSVGQ